MIYIYSRLKNTTVSTLLHLLSAKRLKQFDGLNFRDGSEIVSFDPEDRVVCWGSQVDDLDDVKVLNFGKQINRYRTLKYLYNSGVSSVQVRDFPFEVGNLARRNDKRIAEDFNDKDSFGTSIKTDYYMSKMNFKSVYRVHSFNGKSIRAGIKEVRPGWKKVSGLVYEGKEGQAHPWIWSYDLGWRVRYEGFISAQNVRMLAHKAVKALGLTFAAVDIGEVEGGGLFVIKVDPFPFVEGTTLELYAKNIQKWVEGPDSVSPTAPLLEDAGNEEIMIEPEAQVELAVPRRRRAVRNYAAFAGHLEARQGQPIGNWRDWVAEVAPPVPEPPPMPVHNYFDEAVFDDDGGGF